jgi:hypothetical protein
VSIPREYSRNAHGTTHGQSHAMQEILNHSSKSWDARDPDGLDPILRTVLPAVAEPARTETRAVRGSGPHPAGFRAHALGEDPP